VELKRGSSEREGMQRVGQAMKRYLLLGELPCSGQGPKQSETNKKEILGGGSCGVVEL
jgi:hypothetical protein